MTLIVKKTMAVALNVLMILDSPDDASMLCRVIEQSGFRVFSRRVDTSDAMRSVLGDRQWDIILSDYILSDFSAISALTVLKETASVTPFIVVSGSAGEEVAGELMRQGAGDFILKGKLYRLVPAIERELRVRDRQRESREDETLLDIYGLSYRRLVELIQEGVWVLDAANSTVLTNRYMAAMLGYSAGEMAGKPVSAFTDKRGEEIYRLVTERLRRGLSERHDFEFTKKDGGKVYVSIATSPVMDGDGNYRGAVSAVTDISTRKNIEEELINNYQFLQTVVDNVPNPMFYKDAQGRFIGCNKSFESFSGFKREEIVGKTSYDIFPRELADMHQAADAALFKRGALQTYEGSAMDKDGRVQNVIYNKALFWRSDGTLGGLVGTVADVTDMKRAEKEKEEMQVQLIHSSKMAALGQLVAGVANELNNPLTIIMGNMQYLLDRPIEHAELRRIFTEVEQASQRCKKIVNDLLEFSRHKGMGMNRCAVNDLVELVVNLCCYQYDTKKIRIERHYAQHLPFVTANVTRLEQVFLNVVSNACQAIYGEGVLEITTRFDEMKGVVETVFADTGTGIEFDHLPRIFEPFFTTKKKGAGLGLSVSYNILQQYGGDIRVESSGPGKGTTVTITLPAEALPA